MKKLLALCALAAVQLFAADAPTAAALKNRIEPYRLQASDEVELSYRYTPEYDQSVQIRPDGYGDVKLIGSVKLAGLTLDEARAALLTGLQARLNDPEITVTLRDFVRPSYVVAGQVGSPGKYELHGDVSAMEAVAIAGGFKDTAKHSQVLLFHRVNNDLARARILDLKRFSDPKTSVQEQDVMLQPGDILVVPKNRVSKISDYIHWVSVGSYIPL